MQAVATKAVKVWLREERVVGFAPLAAGMPRVDRKKSIIYGVKISSLHSSNTHGVAGAEGTDYEPSAYVMAVAKRVYEGIKVNVNHPPRGKGQQERDAEDRLGKIFNVRLHEEEPYGDLKLIPSHRMTSALLDAAEDEDLTDCFALSHNALGKGEVRNHRYVVTEIPEVHSVDLVADGGSNTSLFEGREVKQVKLGKLLESKPNAKGIDKIAELLSVCPPAGEMLVNVTEAEDDAGDYRDHLHAAKKMCEDSGDTDMAKKIHGLMKPVDEAEEEEEPGEKKEEPAEKKDEPEKTEETRRRKPSTDPHVRELQERLELADLREWVRKRADAKEIPLTDKLLGTLVRLRERKAIDEHLDTLRELGVKAKSDRTSAPRSSSPMRPIQESAAPKNGRELAAVLLR